MPIPRNLSKAKQVIQRTFNTEAKVIRLTQVTDSAGGFIDSYATVGTYPCMFYKQGITPFERENTVQVRAQSIWVFVFASGTDVRPPDRLECQGRRFEVVSSGTGSIDIATRVVAMEIL